MYVYHLFSWYSKSPRTAETKDKTPKDASCQPMSISAVIQDIWQFLSPPTVNQQRKQRFRLFLIKPASLFSVARVAWNYPTADLKFPIEAVKISRSTLPIEPPLLNTAEGSKHSRLSNQLNPVVCWPLSLSHSSIARENPMAESVETQDEEWYRPERIFASGVPYGGRGFAGIYGSSARGCWR